MRPPRRPQLWFLALLALAGAPRLAELAISRRHESARGGVAADPRRFPWVVLVNAALFTLPAAEVTLRSGPSSRPRWPWLAVVAAASGLRWWSIASLGEAWNVRALVPADLEPVTRGPYRFIRHPNYLALVLEFAALPMAGGAVLSALLLSVLNGILLAGRIHDEEELLAASPGYLEAFSRKARFIPGIW